MPNSTRETARSFCMILVTGPTGPGKSTTLYALPQEARKGEPHIIAVEEPVERHGEHRADPTPPCHRLYLRRSVAAHPASRSVMSSWLARYHTSQQDARSTTKRCINTGVESYLLSSTLLGVMTQRLMRMVCPHCKEKHLIDPEIATILQIYPGESYYKGRGAKPARTAVIVVDSPCARCWRSHRRLPNLINAKASSQTIRSLALQQGMKTLTECHRPGA